MKDHKPKRKRSEAERNLIERLQAEDNRHIARKRKQKQKRKPKPSKTLLDLIERLR